MKLIEVGSELTYDVTGPTTFLFQITANATEHQQVAKEQLTFNPLLNVESFAGPEGNRLNRVVVQPCELNVSYRATVKIHHETEQAQNIDESNPSEMPPEVLTYLNPSRYCQSDLLADFSFQNFGSLPRGYERARAICDWVNGQLAYTPGSTVETTTADDVLKQRTGVCRDYAHVMITLCRGVGIPARYVSGYAVNLQPPDFHGFVEVYLAGAWYLFDPSGLASVAGLVRIGIGRDAADTAFGTITGNAAMTSKSVWANEVAGDGESPSDDNTGVSTA